MPCWVVRFWGGVVGAWERLAENVKNDGVVDGTRDWTVSRKDNPSEVYTKAY